MVAQTSSTVAGSTVARPYGLLGLVISTLVIMLATGAVMAIAAAVVFGVFAATRGWPETMERLSALTPGGKLSGIDVDQLSIIVGMAFYGAIALSVVLVARFRGGRDWARLVGWNAWTLKAQARPIALLLALTLAWSLTASAAIEQVYAPAKDWVTVPSGTPWIIGFLALATMFAPIAEELFFRGWLFTSLREIIGVRFGIVVSAALFAIAHWESTHLYAAAVFPVGLALGYMRQRADSVAASITLHSLYNGVAAVLLFATK